MKGIRNFFIPSALWNAAHALVFVFTFLLVSGAFYKPDMAYIAMVAREAVIGFILVNALFDSLSDLLFNYVEPLNKDTIITKAIIMISVGVITGLFTPTMFGYAQPLFR
jgi:hypothetical protein